MKKALRIFQKLTIFLGFFLLVFFTVGKVNQNRVLATSIWCPDGVWVPGSQLCQVDCLCQMCSCPDGFARCTCCDPMVYWCDKCNLLVCEENYTGGNSACNNQCGGGSSCFTPDTQIDTPEGQEAIGELGAGEVVESFDLETGEATTSVIQKVIEATAQAYYKIKTADGREVKVTAEHPFWAIKGEGEKMSFWEYLKTESLARKLINWASGMLE